MVFHLWFFQRQSTCVSLPNCNINLTSLLCSEATAGSIPVLRTSVLNYHLRCFSLDIQDTEHSTLFWGSELCSDAAFSFCFLLQDETDSFISLKLLLFVSQERELELQKEQRRQEENDKLRQEFAQHANAFHQWIQETRYSLSFQNMPLENSLGSICVHPLSLWTVKAVNVSYWKTAHQDSSIPCSWDLREAPLATGDRKALKHQTLKMFLFLN